MNRSRLPAELADHLPVGVVGFGHPRHFRVQRTPRSWLASASRVWPLKATGFTALLV